MPLAGEPTKALFPVPFEGFRVRSIITISRQLDGLSFFPEKWKQLAIRLECFGLDFDFVLILQALKQGPV